MFRRHSEWISLPDLQFMIVRYRAYTKAAITKALHESEKHKVLAIKYVNGVEHYKYLPKFLRRNYVTVKDRSKWGPKSNHLWYTPHKEFVESLKNSVMPNPYRLEMDRWWNSI